MANVICQTILITPSFSLNILSFRLQCIKYFTQKRWIASTMCFTHSPCNIKRGHSFCQTWLMSQTHGAYCSAGLFPQHTYFYNLLLLILAYWSQAKWSLISQVVLNIHHAISTQTARHSFSNSIFLQLVCCTIYGTSQNQDTISAFSSKSLKFRGFFWWVSGRALLPHLYQKVMVNFRRQAGDSNKDRKNWNHLQMKSVPSFRNQQILKMRLKKHIRQQMHGNERWSGRKGMNFSWHSDKNNPHPRTTGIIAERQREKKGERGGGKQEKTA